MNPMRKLLIFRHCERSEAISSFKARLLRCALYEPRGKMYRHCERSEAILSMRERE